MQLVAKIEPWVLVTSGSFNIQHPSLSRSTVQTMPTSCLATSHLPGLSPTMTGNRVSQPAWARSVLFQVNRSMHWKKWTSQFFQKTAGSSGGGPTWSLGVTSSIRPSGCTMTTWGALPNLPSRHSCIKSPCRMWSAVMVRSPPSPEKQSSLQSPHSPHYQIKHY